MKTLTIHKVKRDPMLSMCYISRTQYRLRDSVGNVRREKNCLEEIGSKKQ